jgi:predicted dithiol-disulfide oxidoreductase (DUF899 family)
MTRSNVAHSRNVEYPRTVSRAEWLAARKELLIKEKEFTRLRDQLSAERRRLPMVKIEKKYKFDGPNGRTNLRDLFEGRRQLIIYHFMFDPSWDEGCPSCSHCADNFEGCIVHLGERDTAFAAISRAPLAKIESFKKRMGWTFRWLSSFGDDSNYDIHVTLDEVAGSVEYNYADAAALHEAGKLWLTKGELPGLSVFLRDCDSMFHTYSTYTRGLDLLLNTYNYLDLTPLGRQDDQEGNPQGWIRHHDRYDDHPKGSHSCCGSGEDHT